MNDYSLEEIQQAIAELEAKGLIYDTGERRISPTTGRQMIVWGAVPTTEN